MAWDMVKLGDVANLYQPKTISQKDLDASGEFFVYGANGIIGKYDKYNHENSEVTITCRGATCGTINVTKPKSWITGNAMVVAPLNLELNRKFLFFALEAANMELIITGAAQPQITRSNLKDLKIPLPPLEEQKRIAAILDKAHSIRQKREQNLNNADALIKSIFLDMFGDPVTNPKGWEKNEMRTIVTDLEAGWSVGGESRVKTCEEIGVLKVSAVTSGTFKPSEYKVIANKFAIKKYVSLQKGDLLFSRANTRELVGATCIVDKNYTDLILPDKIWKIHNTQNNDYIKFALSSLDAIEQMTNEATGTSGSMYNISMEKLKSIKIPLPPIGLQNKFAEIVTKIEAQKAKQKQHLHDSDQCFKALQQRFLTLS